MALSEESLILLVGLLTRRACLGNGECTRHMTVGPAEA